MQFLKLLLKKRFIFCYRANNSLRDSFIWDANEVRCHWNNILKHLHAHLFQSFQNKCLCLTSNHRIYQSVLTGQRHRFLFLCEPYLRGKYNYCTYKWEAASRQWHETGSWLPDVSRSPISWMVRRVRRPDLLTLTWISGQIKNFIGCNRQNKRYACKWQCILTN